MLTLYLIFGILYLFTLFFIGQKSKFVYQSKASSSYNPTVSVILPFRNEASNLPVIFQCLVEQQYSKMEVIWVDDHSTDHSNQLLLQMIERTQEKNMRILKNSGIGKKAAITTAINYSQSDLIFTTDADCFFSAQWISKIVSLFISPEIKFVAGSVMIKNESGFLKKFQIIEWCSILFITNFLFTIKRPSMCSAANMAYRRVCFDEVGGYIGNERILSGDDEFLLKKFLIKYSAQALFYHTHQETLVWTRGEMNFLSLLSQRIRWVSKWNKHDDLFHEWMALLPFIIQIFFFLSILLLNEGLFGILVFISVWGLKMISERMVLGRILDIYSIKLSWSTWIASMIFHPFYVLCVGLGVARGKYSWKGRNQF
jgi:poly-beta-1,6-N-acetyl-D-glucosamine synthase